MAERRQQMVVIAAGGTAIGRAVAAAFVEDGARVVVIGRRAEPLRHAAELLGPSVSWRRADLGDREQIAQTIESIAVEYGTIDVLVNEAGIVNQPGLTRTPLEVAERLWDEYARVNVKGALLTTLAAVPHLARPGGRIIFISSVAVSCGGALPGLAAYAAGGAALQGLTRSLARELGPDGITVNMVVPGSHAGAVLASAVPEDDTARLAATALVTHGESTGDVASTVHFLGSSAAAHVTARVVPVDGRRLPG